MLNDTFYDESYFRGHYGRLFEDRKYRLLLGEYWKHVLFEQNGLPGEGNVLDYGCGLGQVSCQLPSVTLFDESDYIISWLRANGHNATSDPLVLPKKNYQYIISSHSLEHCPDPSMLLTRFRTLIAPAGTLVLILPIETDYQPRLSPDSNLHLFCWTFQTITNLLSNTGWKPYLQKVLYNPLGLGSLGAYLNGKTAAHWAAWAGRVARQYPAMLTLAHPAPCIADEDCGSAAGSRNRSVQPQASETVCSA